MLFFFNLFGAQMCLERAPRLKKVLRMIFIDMDTLAPLGGTVGPLPPFQLFLW